MHRTRKRSYRSVALLMAATIFLATTAVQHSATAGVKTPPDLEGEWEWEEYTYILGPSEPLMFIFGIPLPEGPVMRLTCHASGTLTIIQNGESFAGLTDQTSDCISEGGQVAATPPFPPGFSIEGFITGNAVHFQADVGLGIVCSYNGSLRVSQGTASDLTAHGGCDVPSPFHPNADRISFEARRL